jgi:putative ribosome biogenesis GTPase RsgA
LTKTLSESRPVGDISTFKRPNHSILYAERRARQIKRQHKRNNSQKAIIRRFLTKNARNFRPVGDISTFKRPNHSILYAERSARQIKRRHKRHNSQTAIIRPFLTKTLSEIRPVGDISTFKRPHHSILYAERSARQIKRRHKRNNSQTAIIRPFLTKTLSEIRPVGDISTVKRPNHSIIPAERRARRINRRHKRNNSQIAIIRRF